MRVIVLHIAVLLCGCASSESIPSRAQNMDPQEILNGVGRRLEIEQQQRSPRQSINRLLKFGRSAAFFAASQAFSCVR
jgi:hypothetical protein